MGRRRRRKKKGTGGVSVPKKKGTGGVPGIMIDGMGFCSVSDIEAAANKGDAMAMYNMGYIWFFGKTSLGKDHAKAAMWWTRAAKLGQPNAQNNLGGMYYNGQGGLGVNLAAAEYWWGEAADRGHLKARGSLLALANGATSFTMTTATTTAEFHLTPFKGT